MIAITGAAGFIGSVIAGALNEAGHDDLMLVDDFGKTRKQPNYISKQYTMLTDREQFPAWLEQHHDDIEFIIHLGARTDTTELDSAVFDKLNVNYTKSIWSRCTAHRIPLIYASSAATYGSGEYGYDDSHEIVGKLQPLNAYGISKNEIDKWILSQSDCPPFWAGLKFFNVYGPNEYHKDRMASVILHAFGQINETGMVKLFRSHRPDFGDGQQLRDFIYVKDIADVILWLMQHKPESGLYNVGTGKARSFNDLACNTFKAMDLTPNISYIDTPLDIRDKYQYFTEAKMDKLRKAGYTKPFTSLEDGVEDYVKNYLIGKRYF